MNEALSGDRTTVEVLEHTNTTIYTSSVIRTTRGMIKRKKNTREQENEIIENTVFYKYLT